MERGKIERKLLKTDFLFVPQKNLFKQRSRQGIKTSYWRYNKRLYKHYYDTFSQELNAGLISKETFDSKISFIPRFHAHGLRKWFISTVRENCSNLSVCVQMEGHAFPVGTDRSYVKLNPEVIKEEYFKLIPFLSFNRDVEVQVLTSEKINEYEQEISKIKKEYEQEKERLNNLEDFVKQFQQFDFDKI